MRKIHLSATFLICFVGTYFIAKICDIASNPPFLRLICAFGIAAIVTYGGGWKKGMKR